MLVTFKQEVIEQYSSFKTFLFKVTIITGPNNGEDVFLPWIPLIPSDANLPFDFKQLQFQSRFVLQCPSTKPKANV